MVEYVLSKHTLDLSAKNRVGNTALHLAALQGRDDVVDLLLQQPDIDDSIVNHEGKQVPSQPTNESGLTHFQAFEIAKTPELGLNMQGKSRSGPQLTPFREVNREKFAVETTSTLKEAIAHKDYTTIESILQGSRAKALIHMNRLDPETGSTILHDAARRNDKRLVEILLANGADPIRRDRKGKLPFEITKDHKIRQMLRTTNPPSKSTSTDRPPNEKPYQKGYLKKWTNYARGSKLRWFILDGTTLSYYKSPGTPPFRQLALIYLVSDQVL